MREFLINLVCFLLVIDLFGQQNTIIAVSQPNCVEMPAPIYPNLQGSHPQIVYDVNFMPGNSHSSSFLQLDLVYQQEFNGVTNDLVGDWLPTIY
ncbi:MAG: hypothetical protein ACK40M_08600 [Flavobacteriales bacterium]